MFCQLLSDGILYGHGDSRALVSVYISGLNEIQSHTDSNTLDGWYRLAGGKKITGFSVRINWNRLELLTGSHIN